MLLYTLEIPENTDEIIIGEVVQYYDKRIKIIAINLVDFKKKKLIVRGLEIKE